MVVFCFLKYSVLFHYITVKPSFIHEIYENIYFINILIIKNFIYLLFPFFTGKW